MELYEDDMRIKNSSLSVGNTPKCVKTRDNDSPASSQPLNDNDDLIPSRKTLTGFEALIMPTELYISFNSDAPANNVAKSLARRDRLEFLSHGRHSTPASPEEMERKHQIKDAPCFHSPVSDKKVFGSYSSSGFVRTSKSEDHLQKSSLTTVNIDIEDEMASSLDTLLDSSKAGNSNEYLDCSPTSPVAPPLNCEEAALERPPSSSSPTKSGDDHSPSSSETSSPSKLSVRFGDIPLDTTIQVFERQHSDSSGSEIIPSESSTTIRKNECDCSEGECTSEQISAISSLDGSAEHSGSNSDYAVSPSGSLSPSGDFQLDEDWLNTVDASAKDEKGSVSEGKSVDKTKQQVPPNTARCQSIGVLQVGSCEQTNHHSSSSAAPKLENSIDQNKDSDGDSPTSPCSEDTFADVSYHELTESYDEVSVAEVDEEPSIRNSSPTESATDDESDIESLHSFHYSPKAVDLPSASRLAKRLYNLDGFKKSDVSRHLSKNNEFSRAVAEEYLKFFDFTRISLDAALRRFLSQFCLIGETQERERVLVHFSKRFLDSNPGSFRSQDAVHTLTCALMLLNSDLHGENVCRKMVCGEFIENLSGLNDGENFPREILKALYHSIKSQPLEWAINEVEEEKKSTSNGHTAPEPRQSYIGHNPFLEVPNPNCATEYKKGYVMRKCCMDPSGKKTPLGRRSWKMLYATLKDLVLYLHKDEHGFKKNQLYDSLHNSVRIHHAFAEKASDYTKKQYVFRLHTADQAVYLFQTSDSKELDSWVDTVNLVAASLSSPSLPSGVGNQRKFQRPLLPVSHTKLNLREQLQDHENRIVWLEKEYEEHLNKTPDRGMKARFLHEHLEKEAHLLYELTRYRTYAYLLRSRMAQFPELDTPMVQTGIVEVEEPVERLKMPNFSSRSHSAHKKHRSASIPMEKDLAIIRQKLEEDTNNSD